MNLFDELVVAVARSAGKNPFFSFRQRVSLLKQALEEQRYASRVKVIGYSNLSAELASEMKASAIIRGLRAVSDFEYEFQMALMNRKMARHVETVFLMPSLSWVYLSSTIVKDVAAHGGDIQGLVPGEVAEAISRKLATAKR